MSKPGFDIRPHWLAQGVEEILDPGLAIIDAHHHFYDRPGEIYLLPELTADLAGGHNICGTVFVQCRFAYRTTGPAAFQTIGEVEAVIRIAQMAAEQTPAYGIGSGIVANADLTLGADVIPVLEAMLNVAGPRFSGIRNSVAWHGHPAVRSSVVLPPSDLMSQSLFREGVRCLSRFDLSLDIWAYQTQHADILALALANPDTIIIVNHLGGPVASGPYSGMRSEMFGGWKAGLAALAALPNTRLKLGGLGMRVGGFTFHENVEPPTSEHLAEAWRPYIETGIALFGANRCMFESNFPVDKGMYSYVTFWNACKRLTAGCSQDEKAALFSQTAAEVYKLNASGAMPGFSTR